MCRNIKVLRRSNGVPTDEELKAAALQFVRKISGYQKPSRANEQVFHQAVDSIANCAKQMFREFKHNIHV